MTLKRSLNVIVNDTIGFPIYDFVLVVKSNYDQRRRQENGAGGQALAWGAAPPLPPASPPSPPLRSRTPVIQLGGLGERCK